MKKIQNMHYFKKGILMTLLTILVFVVGSIFIIPTKDNVRVADMEEVSYVAFKNDLSSGIVSTLYYTEQSPQMYVYTNEDVYYKVANPSYDGFKKELLESDILIRPTTELKTAEMVEGGRLTWLLMLCIILTCISISNFCKSILPESSGKMTIINERKKALSSGGSCVSSDNLQKYVPDPSIKTFSDVAGLSEVKKDMKCIVDFLVNKDKYQEAGAKLPKGIILYGPPGTGKTLLAKAVAGEANVPFLYMSGSEFVELYVGVGARRVRELFAKARRQSPCIVFIDEIDAIGSSRGGKDTNSEDRKTLNALLTEMDGFKETENIIVIAATNRLEDLDPALTRPGRFTNKYCVPLPETVADRLEIINLYSGNKRFDESFNVNALAKETVGFSPAKIEALLNEASIISVQDGSRYITKEIVDKAMFKILLQGHMKEDVSERDEEELKVVAWHEAGHAVLGHLFGNEITKVTVIPSTSGAGGVTFSTPVKTSLLSVSDLKHEVMELYGGRLAELLYYQGDKSKITTGASNDIERATMLIHDIVTKYGMSDKFGMLNLSQANLDNKDIVSCEVELAKELENEALSLLTENESYLSKIANMLIENNTIYSSDIDKVFENVA